MTDQTDQTELTTPTDQTNPEPTNPEATEATPGRREAKYRRELREAEAELDTLRERLGTLQRAEAERLSGLAKGAALWATGTTIADLLDEHGQVDETKVQQATQAARETLGVTDAPRTPRPDLSQGHGHAGPAKVDLWSEAFTPR